jgi:hypothetical protein
MPESFHADRMVRALLSSMHRGSGLVGRGRRCKAQRYGIIIFENGGESS